MLQVIKMKMLIITLDFFIVILIAILVIVTAIFFYHLFSSVTNHIRISRFLARYQPSEGIVLQYEKNDEETVIRMSPIFMGKSMLFMPRTALMPEEHYVSLECRCADKHFRATYQIPEEDYKQERTGTSVQIKCDWEPIGYTLL